MLDACLAELADGWDQSGDPAMCDDVDDDVVSFPGFSFPRVQLTHATEVSSTAILLALTYVANLIC